MQCRDTVPATLAQEPPEPEPDTNTDDALEIVEKQGGHDRWPTWYVSVGGTWLGADGLYSLDIPDIGEIPILDFDTIGLDDTDTSQYFSINWRSRDSRWGAWLANWNPGHRLEYTQNVRLYQESSNRPAVDVR